MATQPFGPEELKARSREAFTGNECDTDQYGETQPAATLSKIGTLADMFSEDPDQMETLMDLVAPWVLAASTMGRYDGAAEAEPIHNLYHDTLWAEGQHPYHGNDRADYVEYLADTLDTEAEVEQARALFVPFVAIGEAQIRAQEDQILADAERIKARRAAE